MQAGPGDLLRALAVAIGFPAAAYAIGASIAAWDRRLDRQEQFCVAWAVGLAWLALGQFVGFSLGLRSVAFPLLWLAAPVSAAAARWWRAGGPPRAGAAPAVGLVLLGYVHLVLIQALLSAYEGGSWFYDWWMHYDEALVFLGRQEVGTRWLGRYTLASRTPLFNLSASWPMAIAGEAFWVFQLAASLANFAVVPAAALVIRDLSGPRAARLALLLAPMNLWIMHNAWFTWPKMLCAAYLLIALHFHLKALRVRDSDPSGALGWALRGWVAGLLGFMTHQVAAVYLVAIAATSLGASIRSGFRPLPARHWAACGLAAVAIVGPWYAWTALEFGLRSAIASTPTMVMPSQAPLGAGTLLNAVPRNLLLSFFPDRLVGAARGGDTRAMTWYDLAMSLYFNQVPGLLTLSLTLFLLWRGAAWAASFLAGRARDAPGWPGGWWAAAGFAGLGGLGSLVLVPQVQAFGVAHAVMFPSAIVLAMAGWAALATAGGRLQRLVLVGMLAEFLLAFWVHVGVLALVLPDLPRDTVPNIYLKRSRHLTSLADLLGGGVPLAALACGAAQLGFCVKLLQGGKAVAGARPIRDPGSNPGGTPLANPPGL